MDHFIIYLLKVSVCLLLFYSVYYCFLRRLTFYKWSRFYLLITLVVSTVIPSLSLPLIVKPNSIARPFISAWHISEDQTGKIISTAGNTINWLSVIDSVYFIFASIMLFRFVASIIAIITVYRRNPIQYSGNTRIVKGTSKINNCSFFDTVFLNIDELSKEEYEQIIKHEQCHIRKGHTYDKLFLNLMQSVFWFNPVIYFYRKSLEEVHEFEADAILTEKTDKQEYANLLLRLATNGQLHVLNCFSEKPLKARIEMLFSRRSTKIKRIAYFISLPIILYTLAAFSIKNISTLENKLTENKISAASINKLITKESSAKTQKGNIKPGKVFTSNPFSEKIITDKKEGKNDTTLNLYSGTGVNTFHDKKSIENSNSIKQAATETTFITRNSKKDNDGKEYDEVKLSFGKYNLWGNLEKNGKLLFMIGGKKYEEEELKKMKPDQVANFSCPCKIHIREKETEPLIEDKYDGVIEISKDK